MQVPSPVLLVQTFCSYDVELIWQIEQFNYIRELRVKFSDLCFGRAASK